MRDRSSVRIAGSGFVRRRLTAAPTSAPVTGHALVGLVTLFAVLVMHGLACMAGDDHAPRHLPPLEPAIATVAAGPAHAVADRAAQHAHAQDIPATEPATAIGLVAGIRGGGFGPSQPRHQAAVPTAVCVAILPAGVVLLFALALLAALTSPRSGDVHREGASARWRRARAPTARLRPSPFALCVLRT